MRLHPYLQEQGISLSAFGQWLGVSRQAISKLASGENVPSFALLHKIHNETNGVVTFLDFVEHQNELAEKRENGVN